MEFISKITSIFAVVNLFLILLALFGFIPISYITFGGSYGAIHLMYQFFMKEGIFLRREKEKEEAEILYRKKIYSVPIDYIRFTSDKGYKRTKEDELFALFEHETFETVGIRPARWHTDFSLVANLKIKV